MPTAFWASVYSLQSTHTHTHKLDDTPDDRLQCPRQSVPAGQLFPHWYVWLCVTYVVCKFVCERYRVSYTTICRQFHKREKHLSQALFFITAFIGEACLIRTYYSSIASLLGLTHTQKHTFRVINNTVKMCVCVCVCRDKKQNAGASEQIPSVVQ